MDQHNPESRMRRKEKKRRKERRKEKTYLILIIVLPIRLARYKVRIIPTRAQ
jgi:hypothetical protein